MITLTRLNGETFTLSVALIERVEAHPDTTIHTVNGHVHMVKESLAEVTEKVRGWHIGIRADAIRVAAEPVLPTDSPATPAGPAA